MHDEREEAHHHIVLSLGSLRGPWDRGRADRQTGGRDGRTGWADRRAGRVISISLALIPDYGMAADANMKYIEVGILQFTHNQRDR